MKLMLDTNICIHIIRRKPAEVLARFKEYEMGDIAISSITVAELQFGVAKSLQPERNLQALDQFLLPLTIVDFDHAAAAAYGRCRAALESQGRPIRPLDTLIAAHALSLELPLVTNNTAEFARVAGLNVENWVTRG